MKVVVVGAGVAGLAACARLADRHEVTLLEARPTLPSRAIAPQILGATRALDSLLALVSAEQERRSEAAPLELSALSWADRARLLKIVFALVHPSARWPRASDSESVERWLDRIGQSARARRGLWRPLTLEVLGEEPHAASARLLEQVLAEALWNGRGAHLALSRVGLAAGFTERAARFVEDRGGRIITNAEVAELRLVDRIVRGVTLASGRRFDADVVIATVAPAALFTLIPPALRESERWCAGLAALDGPLHLAGAESARPGVRSPFEGLLLAGPFVRTGLPAQLESAARSAEEAVRLAEDYLPAPSAPRPRESGSFVPLGGLRRPQVT